MTFSIRTITSRTGLVWLLREESCQLLVDQIPQTPSQSGRRGSNEDHHGGDEQDGARARRPVIGERRGTEHEFARGRGSAPGSREFEHLFLLLRISPTSPERGGRQPQDRGGDRNRDDQKKENFHHFESSPGPLVED